MVLLVSGFQPPGDREVKGPWPTAEGRVALLWSLGEGKFKSVSRPPNQFQGPCYLLCKVAQKVPDKNMRSACT